MPKITTNPLLITWGNYFIHLAILLSFLGGFYGMFYFNNWNLFAIAEEKNIIYSSYLTKLNKNRAPWVCVFVQFFLATIFLIFTQKETSLAVMGDFGVMTAYFLSVIAFLTLYKKISGYLALLSSLMLMYLCTKNLFSYGPISVLPFFGIIVAGIFMYRINTWNKKRNLKKL